LGLRLDVGWKGFAAFITAQFIGMLAAVALGRWLWHK